MLVLEVANNNLIPKDRIMKPIAKKIFVCYTALLMLFSQSLACTALTLVKNSNTVSGRTIEWGFNLNWQLIYIPKRSKHYNCAK